MKKHIEFYKNCMKTGALPSTKSTGLCGCASEKYINEAILYLFEPTYLDNRQIEIDGHSIGWWGAGVPSHDNRKFNCFTPLRQTIVLFMAALNNEL